MPKIHSDLDFLMTCFGEVLRELGEEAIAARLPWLATDAASAERLKIFRRGIGFRLRG
jgi:hypothetical protein